MLANGLGEVLNVPVQADMISRITATSTQTHKSRLERWHNVKDVFTVPNPIDLNEQHILLIDDVITTGATLEGCIQCIQAVSNARISVYASAVA